MIRHVTWDLHTLPVRLSRLHSSAVALPHRFTENLHAGRSAIVLSVFAWLNSILIRCAHYRGNPLILRRLQRSVLVKACFSIFRSLTSLCSMLFATRKRLRQLWLAGAGLLSIVIVRLFPVDLSNSGTVERIVSFVGVGVLKLAVGYLSPVPPQGKAAEVKKQGCTHFSPAYCYAGCGAARKGPTPQGFALGLPQKTAAEAAIL